MKCLEEIWNEAEGKFPENIMTSIRRYLSDNRVLLDYFCDDGAIARVREKFIPDATWAATVITPDKIHIAFAEKFLLAPTSVQTTVIHHELIHIFISPVLHQIRQHRPLPKDGRDLIRLYREKFEAISPLRHEKRALSNEYEESLVSFINTTIGNNEEEAKRLFLL